MEPKIMMISQELRKMESSQGAEWLIANYPIENPTYWEVFQLIPHVSWKRADQIRLAKYYLKILPFASAKPYEVFASFMSFSLFAKVIRELFPVDSSDRELLLYHLGPVLESAAKTELDKELLHSLINELT